MDDSKFFEAALALAQGLSQWDLLIIAGSMLLVVNADYYRPPSRKMRLPYLLFLPAWVFLALSIYKGTEIQGSYVAYLVAARRKDAVSSLIDAIASKINSDMTWQIRFLELALLCLSVWLVIFVFWWVLSNKIKAKGEK